MYRVERFSADEFFGFVGELLDVAPYIAGVLAFVVELGFAELAVGDGRHALATQPVFQLY